MKNFLKKLHRGSNQSENSASSKSHRMSDGRPSDSLSHTKSEHKPSSAISGWLNSVTNKPIPSPPIISNVREEGTEASDSVGSSSLDAALDPVRHDSASINSRDHIEEEYQIQMALDLSAKEDPEAVQIEAVKQISLGSCPPENAPAEIVAFRYWNYNALSYDDKILDGFYDLYGILTGSTSPRMPSLADLQGTPISDDISWEAILVNRAADPNLLSLELKALDVAFRLRSQSVNFLVHNTVQKLATLVSNHMGGPVSDPDRMLTAWRNLSHTLKASHGSMVLPLGSLTIGLARHRALLFKVLADSLAIPCRLVKGRQFTGSDDVAMNFVKIDGEREYIVDLMAAPGTLIPSDATGAYIDSEDSLFPPISHLLTDVVPSHMASSSAGKKELMDRGEYPSSVAMVPRPMNKELAFASSSRISHGYAHARSPSWTEGISSPAARRMKVKDASEYMIDAAKENPQLAQKLHNVLLESGVVAPPDLFTEMCSERVDILQSDDNPLTLQKEKKKDHDKHKTKGYSKGSFLPPLPHHGSRSRGDGDKHTQQRLDKDMTEHVVPPDSELAPSRYTKNVPVAAAAVVASSMAIAAAKANSDPKLQLPMAATATAAVVVATTAAVTEQYEALESAIHLSGSPGANFTPVVCARSSQETQDTDLTVFECGSGDRNNEGAGANPEGERISARSTGNESSKLDVTLDDVSDCEIPWEDISLGERIGLGSYGEVYRGDWHGTEVAVKRFLNQDIIGESLEEFKSEVLIMRRVRHPNVVLFMGAVTRPPYLSIVTEFHPRGSLYRLLHRPNNQLDERRRLRMALDAARGMNYLHNCSPMIVHRDLKSPNLLVDKNWVVKVCDFGLSRIKHSTFLSSRSTAGTAEWMAPEVLRNEPSNEKCDVYSFGVILWELCTLQQPWGGMNPMQVVGAVGFQHRRLDLPDDMDPVIARIILKCWQTDPNLRPSFAEILAALKPLQKPVTASQVPRPRTPSSKG